nr:hypothetical protein [Schwartzia sp. (in: firmicutes)]
MFDQQDLDKSKYPLHAKLGELRADFEQKYRDYWQISRVDQRVAYSDAEKDYWTRREDETHKEQEEAETKYHDFKDANQEGLDKEEAAMREERERQEAAERANTEEKSL